MGKSQRVTDSFGTEGFEISFGVEVAKPANERFVEERRIRVESLRIHGAGIFTYIGIIWKITLGVNVGKYSSTMDPLGIVFFFYGVLKDNLRNGPWSLSDSFASNWQYLRVHPNKKLVKLFTSHIEAIHLPVLWYNVIMDNNHPILAYVIVTFSHPPSQRSRSNTKVGEYFNGISWSLNR